MSQRHERGRRIARVAGDVRASHRARPQRLQLSRAIVARRSPAAAAADGSSQQRRAAASKSLKIYSGIRRPRSSALIRRRRAAGLRHKIDVQDRAAATIIDATGQRTHARGELVDFACGSAVSTYARLAPRAAARHRRLGVDRQMQRAALVAMCSSSKRMPPFSAASCARRTSPSRARSPPARAAGGSRAAPRCRRRRWRGRSVRSVALRLRHDAAARLRLCAELVVLELGGAGREGAESHRVVAKVPRTALAQPWSDRGAREGASHSHFTAFRPTREK